MGRPAALLQWHHSAPSPLFPLVHIEDGDRGGRHAGDAGGLAQGGWTDAFELLAHLGRQPGDGIIVQVGREWFGLQLFERSTWASCRSMYP